uniref:Phospholipid phosphatase related 5 n=1 Tax=Chelydra serpentina TaxID=8475 RepID=A0A8C3SZU4_CHESE
MTCLENESLGNMISSSRHQTRRSYTVLPCFILVEMVIMAGTVMLAYYFEYTDTFTVNVQGFFCYEGSYRKPYPGPEDSSAVPPALLYALAAGVPVLVIIVGETAVFCLQLATRDFENQEKTILTGDCCYINPLVRRTIRFLGIYAFGLFATDIFVNAGQVVTGNLAPHFLALCKPNYTALGCQQFTQFISGVHACTGNPDLIMRARKTFPSKEAALSVYAATYLTWCPVCPDRGPNIFQKDKAAVVNTLEQISCPVLLFLCHSVMRREGICKSPAAVQEKPDVYYQHNKSQRNKACKTCSVLRLNVFGISYWYQQSSRVSKSLVRCDSRIYNWNINSSVFGCMCGK